MMGEIRNGVTSATGAYALAEASNNQIIFYSLNSSNVVVRVRYFSSAGTLKKGIVVPTGNPLSYNLGSETVTTVQTNLANAADPLFYYYDGNYNGTGLALIQPVSVVQVRMVKLNLEIYKTPNSANSAYTITAGASIRNLKTNLGN